MRKKSVVILSITAICLVSTLGMLVNSNDTNSKEAFNRSVSASTSNTSKRVTFKKEVILDDTSTEVSIISAGDILFHMPQVVSAAEKGTYNFKPMFSEVKEIIESQDIAVANFETTVNPNKNYSGYPSFNTPVQALEALKDTGFDVLLNAHNHTLDTGLEGLRSTNKYMKDYGFKVVGSGEPQEDKSVIIEKNGIKIGMLTYTYGTNYGVQYKDMINYIDETKIKNEIANIETKCDFLIVYLHLGTEYVRTVETFQQKLVNNVAEMGADAILCSHPHVARKTEMINTNGREVLVNYSMGNFISNQNDKYTDIGSMQSITIEKKGSTTRIKSTETIPVYRLRYSDKGKMVYKTLPSNEVEKFSNIVGASAAAYVNEASSQLAFKYDAPKLPPLQRRVLVELEN